MKSNLPTIVFYLVLGILIIVCILLILPFIKILGWAIIFAIITYPLHSKLNNRIKNSTISALLSCIIIIVLILIPAGFIISGIIHQGRELSNDVQGYIKDGKFNKILEIGIINNLSKLIRKYVDTSKFNFQETLQNTINHVASYIGKYSVTIIKNVLLFLIQVGLTLIILFFMLKDGKRILSFIKPLIPLSENDTELILKKVEETIRATIHGWIIIGMIQGALLCISFWILGLPSPLFWGAVTVILCCIPYAGAPIIWVPTVIILFIQKFYLKAILLAFFGCVIIGLVDNLLRPILVGVKLHLHPMIIFFGIFGGLILIGPLGLFLGPVIIALTATLLDALKYKLRPQENSEVPVQNIEE